MRRFRQTFFSGSSNPRPSAPGIISVLSAIFITISAPAAAFDGPPAARTSGSVYPHILDAGTYTLNTRNIKVLKSAGPHLWMGTSSGAILYDTGTAEDYQVLDNKNGLLSNGIFAIAFDNKGAPWIGTYGGGLSRLEKNGWRNYNTPDGLCDAFVYDVEFADDGAIWIATWSGVNRVRGDIRKRASWQSFTVENTGGGLIDNWVYAIELGRDGKVWFGTESGISLYDGKSWRGWNHTSGLGAPPEQVAADNAGAVAAFRGSHHLTIPSGAHDHAAPGNQPRAPGMETDNPDYRPNYVVAMLLDKHDRLWIGTWGAGLSLFDTRSLTFRNFTVKNDGLPGNYVLALKEDPAGNLWIGTNNGLGRFDGKTFTHYGAMNGLSGDKIFSIEIDRELNLWVGGSGAMHRLRLDPKTLEPLAKN